MYFTEITCWTEETVPIAFVMGKVMDVLHLAFVNLHHELGHNPIGVGFPEYLRQISPSGRFIGLGTTIRLFSREAEHLERLKLAQQLRHLDDYLEMREGVALERPNLKYAIFERVQPKTSRERLVRRQAKRKGLDESEIRALYHTFDEQRVDLPFLQLHSLSTGQPFRLFINKQTAEAPTEWQFGTYGLSNTVAVPDF